MFGLVNDILEREHDKLEKALNKIDFRHYQQIEAVLTVLSMFTYDKLPRLLGVRKSIYNINGFEHYVDNHNARQHVNSILKQLDRKKFIDKARWNFRGGILQKDVVKERKEFIRNISQKMTDQIEADKALFKQDVWAENRHALVHLSAYLDADNHESVLEAIEALPIIEEEKKKSVLMAITEQQKAELKVFFIDNFDDLKRLCVVNEHTVTLIEAEQHVMRLGDRLNSDEYTHHLEDICDSTFARDGMRFFLSPAFVAGIGTSVYGLMTAAIIAGVLSILSLTGTALAVATVLCTIVFIILAPKFIYKGVNALVEHIHNWYADRLQGQMRDEVPEYDACLVSQGFFRAVSKESINEEKSSFDSAEDVESSTSVSSTA